MAHAAASWVGVAVQMGGSLAALAGLGGYTYLLWGRRPAPALTAEAALERFRHEHPEVRAQRSLVLEDGRTALIGAEAAGELGLVSAFGRGWTTQVLRAEDVRKLVRDRRGAVHLLLRDFAHPRVTLRFASPAAEAEWLDGLEAGK